jgi:glutathione S-transferase
MNAWLASTVHVSHAHRVRGARWSDDPQVIEGLKVKVSANMAAHMADIEKLFFKGPWVLGGTWSSADCYLYTVWRWLPSDGVDQAAYPRVAAHARAMEARPAVQRALTVITGKG